MKFSVLRQIASQFSPPTTAEEHARLMNYLQSSGFDISSFYQEIEMTSAYVDTHRDVSYSSQTLSLHSHAFWEILFCSSCQDMEYLVGTQRYKLQQGDVIIVAPGVSHMPLFPEKLEVPYKRYALWLSPAFLELMGSLVPETVSAGIPQFSLLRTAGTPFEYIEEFFRTGVKEAERRLPNYEAAIIGNTVTLLTHNTRAFLAQGTKHSRAEKPELLDRVLSYIEARLSQRITVEETARHFFVSGSTIQQTFRQKLGTSFYRCVTQRRLIAAKTMIAQGMSLESVGRAVGFSDYSSFYRAFKKEYGITPRQFTRLQ